MKLQVVANFILGRRRLKHPKEPTKKIELHLTRQLSQLSTAIVDLENISQSDAVYPSAKALANHLLDRCYILNEPQILQGNYMRLQTTTIQLLPPDDFSLWLTRELDNLFDDIEIFIQSMG